MNKSEPGWYLSTMVKSTKPPPYAWLDPSTLYANPEALQAAVEELTRPFKAEDIDMVAGIEAMGYPLGAAIAYHWKKGFFPLRKAGTLCVETNSVKFYDYQKTEKALELRINPFPEGTRVFIVDQWIETGGTMNATIKLIEDAKGVVAGIGVICCEKSDGGKAIKEKYQVHTCVPPHMQDKFDNRTFFD